MSICTYDNPETMARECWQDGKLLCHYSAALFALQNWQVPAGLFFLGANIGQWKSGQIVGDSNAMITHRDKV